MKIIIAGAGAVGTHLAKLLSGEKQDIILMDEDESKLSAMGNNPPPRPYDCQSFAYFD